MKKNSCKGMLHEEWDLVMPSVTISLEMQKTHVDPEHKRYLKAKGLYTLDRIVNI